MRRLSYGQFDLQAAAFVRRQICGRSLIIDRDESNVDAAIDVNLANELLIGAYASNASYKAVCKIELAYLRSILGHAPVILNATFWTWELDQSNRGGLAIMQLGAYRLLAVPDFTDASFRNRDATGPVRWTDDGYSPQHGVDVAASPFATIDSPNTRYGNDPTDYCDPWNFTSELAYALLANKDLLFLVRWHPLNSRADTPTAKTYRCPWSVAGKRPYLDIKYQFSVELFMATSGGTIDLAHPLDAQSGLDEYRLYVGAVERGETSTAVKGFIKNLRRSSIPHLELWDDAPEAAAPVELPANTGTGALTYVELATAAVSQRYYVRMTSASAFEVKGTAYRANATSLNPTYGTTGWDGDIDTDWTAPEGGLTIPAAAWRAAGLTVGDEFEFTVLGNSTLPEWPADAGDQLEITDDSGGAPNAANWRPARGRRTKTSAIVTIGATTVKFPTRAIVTSQWVVGGPAFVADFTSINEGVVDSVDAAAIAAEVFTGSGLDDMTSSALNGYSGAADRQYRVAIDGTGTPDTFKWSNDNGATWEATAVNITGAVQHLEDGVAVEFAATTGHTLTDRWDFAATCWGVTLSGLTNDAHEFAVGSYVGTTLPFRNLAAAYWQQLTAAAGPAQTVKNRLYLPVTTGLAENDILFVQDLDVPEVTELGTILGTPQATYVNLDANLSVDFGAGALVMKVGSGEVAFWARARATLSTTEERKDFRLNVRT